MGLLVRKVVSNIPRAISQPGRALKLMGKRLLPFAVLAKDPEAYQIISSWTFGRLERVPLAELFEGVERSTVTIAKAFDRTAQGSPSSGEILALAAITQCAQPRRILEIGTYKGNTTLNFAANSPPDAKVVTIDLPPAWNGDFALEVPRYMINVTRATVGGQFKDTAYSGKITQVLGDSAKIDWQGLPSPFDLVFIDGCHSYDYVKSDTTNALRHVRKGGLVVWHDYGIIKDVSDVVDETAMNVRIRAVRGTTLAVGFVA